MALEGTLSDFSLPDIFQLISLQRKSGILTLKADIDVVFIYFAEGNILAADSQQDRIENRLGYNLIRARLINEEQLRRALEIQKETLQRLGNILLSQNMVSVEDLQKTLQLVITQKIYRVFRWRDGEYHFDADAPVEFKDDYFTPIPAQGVLMEAVRMTDEWPMLEKEIATLDIIFKKTGKYHEKDVAEGKSLSADDLFSDDDDFGDLFGKPEESSDKLEAEDERILRFVDGNRTVKDIMLDAQVTDFDACHALVSLLHGGYIEMLEKFRVDKKAEWVESTKAEKLGPPVGKIFTPILLFMIFISLIMMNFIPFNHIVPFGKPETSVMKEQKFQITINNLNNLSAMVKKFYYTNMIYPASLEQLAREGYITSSMLKDAWGNEFVYKLYDKKYLIMSTSTVLEPERLKIQVHIFQ